jgi:hypothetical protein
MYGASGISIASFFDETFGQLYFTQIKTSRAVLNASFMIDPFYETVIDR